MHPRASWLLLLALLVLPPLTLCAAAQECNIVPVRGLVPQELVSFDDEVITVTATPVGFTPSKIVQAAGTAVRAFVQVQDASITFRLSGGTPTATATITVVSLDHFVICGATDIANFLAVRTTGTNGTLRVIYSRVK